MKRIVRLLKTGTIVAGTIWFLGCGGGNVKRDLLTIELEAREDQVSQMRELADTLSNTRTRTLEDFNNMVELNNMTPEQVTVLEEETAPSGSSIFEAIKKLWPF